MHMNISKKKKKKVLEDPRNKNSTFLNASLTKLQNRLCLAFFDIQSQRLSKRMTSFLNGI